VSLSSANASVAAVPTSVTVAPGATSSTFALSTTAVQASTAVSITATAAGVSRAATLTVTPAAGGGALPAPSLGAPAVDARFQSGQAVLFDWSDVAGAATYTIQIDDSSSFSSPFVLAQTVSASQLGTSTLPTQRMWWRVRANGPSGSAGAWSGARRFEVKN
jgi:hypothetical protein